MRSLSGEEIRSRGRHLEWLESDGLGGFAMGTVSGIRTRRYHGLLTIASKPPAGRMLLLNGVNVSLETPRGLMRLTPQEYLPGALDENYGEWMESFSFQPWPCWIYQISEHLRLVHELFLVHGKSQIVLSWRFEGACPENTVLRVQPFLTGRDFHALHRENADGKFAAESCGTQHRWRPYPGVPGILATTNGHYIPEFYWYRNFFYSEEQARGLNAVEDAAAPGCFEFRNFPEPALLIFQADASPEGLPFDPALSSPSAIFEVYAQWQRSEKFRREQLGSELEQAADAYVVRRGSGKTVIAGYPWFGDWGRDTFIALRGICLSTKRWPEAEPILLEWAGTVSQGMLPNRFPDNGEEPEYNSVDASLWYIVACYEYLQLISEQSSPHVQQTVARLWSAIRQILFGYSSGTRFGIRLDADGLLTCGQPGLQLTWMDAKVGDWVVTPRIGKPVEIQALWLNALWIGARKDPVWQTLLDKGMAAFRERFWNAGLNCLFDVVDADHQPGQNDARLRPNQIFAVGGLPLNLLGDEPTRQVIEVVEKKLWTPMGLRSLAPGEPDYCPFYFGGIMERDGSYHQGTVWPWLAGPFIQAWVRAHGNQSEAKKLARERFFEPLLAQLRISGLGHLSEIADGDPPHSPRGCPFQAWSVGELLRVARLLAVD